MMPDSLYVLRSSLQFDLHKTSIAALAFLVWENLITFDDEVEYIWRKPWTAWIKAVFLFLRYFPLAIQLCNRIIDEKIIQQQDLRYSTLRTWYISQVVVAHLAMTGVELVMMARVYALYRNSRWMGWGFLCLWLGETIAVLAGLFITLPGVHFTSEQFLLRVPHSFAYLAISTLVSQAIILGLTLRRYIQGQWSGTSLGKLLIRDGSIVYFVFFVTTMTAAVYSIGGLNFGMTEYAWYLSIISAAGCRLILNMQRLPLAGVHDPDSCRGSSLELTTIHYDTERYTAQHPPDP
ncbi:hypothetical protein MVEN_00527200 [Mycena venus]|uniref:DUF6533 domain-containing protein n=1 Tax=Mycena venus TaxID=2733690 RepID=A0A8H7D7M6_9AGAR|nr:hypothetical protein MVEN_00527200 [Mycena venus]